MRIRSAWGIIQKTVGEFASGPILALSAATAYYAAFSIAPLLVLAVNLAGVAFGQDAVRSEIHRQLVGFLGQRSTKLVESMMNAQVRTGSPISTMIVLVALIFGATAVFSQLQAGLNTIWGVTARPGNGIWLYIRDRLLSLAMLLGIGFLLLVSMALTTFVTAFMHYISAAIAVPAWTAPVSEGFVSFVVTSLLFGLIFKVLPDVKIRWRDVWIGAVATALLFTTGKSLLGLYLAHEISASAYGAGSAFVVILLYVYYASLILFFGAVFTKVYARWCGSSIQPSSYAVGSKKG